MKLIHVLQLTCLLAIGCDILEKKGGDNNPEALGKEISVILEANLFDVHKMFVRGSNVVIFGERYSDGAKVEASIVPASKDITERLIQGIVVETLVPLN